MKQIGIIGGDRREEVLSEILIQKNFIVKILQKSPLKKNNHIYYSEKIIDIVTGADVVIAPMSSTNEEGFLKSTFIDKEIKLDHKFFNLLNPDTLFFIGIARPSVKKILESKNIKYIELAKRDDVAILNAIPTAEGALKIAIEETPITLYSNKMLILGLGKVGLTLAWRLRALGAEVYSATRNKGAIARGQDLGIKMVDYQELESYLPQMDIIFNTVPARIIDSNYLSLINKKTVIIDLASSPGGTDFEFAEKKGIKAILAPGIPGKIAPETAGRILGKIIPRLIENNQ